MKTVRTTVTAEDGTRAYADLIVCPNCQESKFIIFMIGKHQHLQCAHCDQTYCDGSCSRTKTPTAAEGRKSSP